MLDEVSPQRPPLRGNTQSMPDIPGSLRDLMAEIGPIWSTNTRGHVEQMIAAFSDVLKHSSRGGVTIHRDIAYGSHERQKLDAFVPSPAVATPPPLVLFVHGGGFDSGHRNRTDEIYSNVTRYLAQQGIAALNVGYRLSTQVTWPGATLDIADAVTWARDHATTYGWDADRIFLMAHSAGAAHAGSYAYDPAFASPGRARLAGIIIVSGRVRIDNLDENPNARRVEQYYGTDDTLYERCSPVHHVSCDSIPTFVAWAEFENPLIDVYCAELVARLAQAKRRSPPMMWLAGHNHSSSIAHIGTSDDRLGPTIVKFIRQPQ